MALVLIMVASTLSVFGVKPADAQSTPTPAVPAFTVELVGPSTVVNTTYSLDQNTGQIVANVGYTSQYSALNITIKNQQIAHGGSGFFYNVRVKIHNSTGNWTDLYDPNSGFPLQSDSEYTTISLNIGAYPSGTQIISAAGPSTPIPVGTQTDIQVQALVGSLYVKLAGWSGELWAFNGAESDWSSTQTVNVPANVPLSSTSTPSPTATTPTTTAASSSQPSSFFLIEAISLTVIAVLLAMVVVLMLLLKKRKISNLPN